MESKGDAESMRDIAPVVSVRELVRRRVGVEADPWSLALVQRHEVWDQVRMRHLLDSLLAGYPIGALLLCRVDDESRVISRQGGERHVEKAVQRNWQLVDGQQRINALFAMLTDQGGYGRFFLNMTIPREPPGPTSKKSSKNRALSHIVWRSPKDFEGHRQLVVGRVWAGREVV